jgi:hypothetical protein
MERARPPMPAPRMASVKGCFGLSPLLERSSGSKGETGGSNSRFDLTSCAFHFVWMSIFGDSPNR